MSTSSMSLTPDTIRTPPGAVRAAFLVWLGALAAGVAELILRWSEAPLAGAAARLGIYAALAVVMVFMRAGRDWARWVLALLLGVFGTLSLVIEPVGWLMDGNSIATFFDGASVTDGLTVVSRTAHLLCVFVAVLLMFRPPANAYFRRSVPSTRAVGPASA